MQEFISFARFIACDDFELLYQLKSDFLQKQKSKSKENKESSQTKEEQLDIEYGEVPYEDEDEP